MLKPLSLTLVAALLSSCSPSGPRKSGFLEKSREEQTAIIGRLPVQQQIPLYLEAMGHFRPRPVGLGVEIAKGGEPSAHVIAQEIRRHDDIIDRNQLLTILISMKEMGIYDSCENPSIRTAILPDEYSTDDPLGHLLYALSVIELCVKDQEGTGMERQGQAS